jgi:hypothetical protein
VADSLVFELPCNVVAKDDKPAFSVRYENAKPGKENFAQVVRKSGLQDGL